MRRSLGVLLAAAMLAACSARVHDLETIDHGVRIALHVDSRIVGEPQFLRVDLDRNHAPLDGADVQLTWTMDSMAMGEAPLHLAAISPGSYGARGFTFSMDGVWHAHLTVHARDGRTYSAVYAMNISD